MEKYYMKKFKKFTDFIVECLHEEYTKIDFNSYTIEEQYNRVTIKLYIKLNSNEYELIISCDFDVPISKILYEAKSDITQIILNCYK